MRLNETISQMNSAVSTMGFAGYVITHYSADETPEGIVSTVEVVFAVGRNTGIEAVLANNFPVYELLSYKEQYTALLPTISGNGVVYRFKWTDSSGG